MPISFVLAGRPGVRLADVRLEDGYYSATPHEVTETPASAEDEGTTLVLRRDEAAAAGPRFDGLRALFVNCTLKRSPGVSHTQGLADRWSDCDTLVYWDEIDREWLETPRAGEDGARFTSSRSYSDRIRMLMK